MKERVISSQAGAVICGAILTVLLTACGDDNAARTTAVEAPVTAIPVNAAQPANESASSTVSTPVTQTPVTQTPAVVTPPVTPPVTQPVTPPALPPATTGTAQLSWYPPTQNTDGSSLTTLAGYRIYYGTDASSMTKVIQITNPGLTSYTVGELTNGTYYFSVSAYSSDGLESDKSAVGSKTI